MSEKSAAQWYFDPPDDDGIDECIDCGHAYASHRGGEDCTECEMEGDRCTWWTRVPQMDEEPPDLEDYMMRQRGLIE